MSGIAYPIVEIGRDSPQDFAADRLKDPTPIDNYRGSRYIFLLRY
jgi:hypothetical protein